MILRLYELPVWGVGLTVALLLVAAMEFGAWRGRRRAQRAPRRREDRSDALKDVSVGALLALMGLILAFTYSLSLNRLDARKQALVHEANAIGTAFLRADLLAEPDRTVLRRHLLDYARTRVLSERARVRIAAAERQIAESLEAQEQLWAATKEATKADLPAHIEMIFVNSVNAVVDAHTLRRAAGYDRLPVAVVAFLAATATAAVAIAANISAAESVFSRARSLLFVLALAALIYIILDFDNSSRGLIRVDQAPLIDVIDQMEAALAAR